MNRVFLYGVISLLLVLSACSHKQHDSFEDVVDEALNFACEQSLLMAGSLKDSHQKLPQTSDRFGQLITCYPAWWVSGFFPGQLWYLYEYSNREELKEMAQLYSERVRDQQFTTDNHDVGFMIFCSYGNAYRITKDTSYLSVINNAAKSLATRYRPSTATIRSWDAAPWNKQWQYPVIIDNMMNLELLMWNARQQNDITLMDIAIHHANATMKNHYRSDYSCYHVVSYDTISGQPHLFQTSQGYSHESAWARGQAWGLYGFVTMYRFTKDARYLEQAEKIASYLLTHPHMPEDKIPYWDFDAPNIPDCYRDASAAAIMCSALIELSTYADARKSQAYLEVAKQQIVQLSSREYRNALGNNANFILKHSVGHMPNNWEIDVPLSYADYYYIEALMRYKNLINE
ncbi:glycoside hydrolase family 88 protein [Carboxylicivirga sp. A043]|uniref:glycoside hydrolase family 88 protein n=1 Tax=Carboxylicivirga litoralis TaxID=2816963 RepID=UPI0021CB2698|nr:glycoside hydrolase family 88 protein [Carboxylicivirga sp. A043]MCU4155628.1 glycoside hydrolase family 88 protein [Carboxylicivirga sp. A043]